MKSVVVSVVRNEADVIELFVRYHARMFDHVFIIDHLSKDGTSNILSSLIKEDLPLTVKQSNSFYHAQGELITDLLKEIRKKHKPSVLMAIDADEFVVGDILRASYDLPKNIPCTLSALWWNYAPDKLFNPHVLKDICYRNSKINPIQHKTLIPGPILDMDVHMREGCHEVYFGKQPLRMVISKHLHLAHFPIRSTDQFMKKALVGWISKLANPANKGKSPNWSHWKMFFDRAKNGIYPSLDELQSFALGYTVDHLSKENDLVYDPVPCEEIELKYPYEGKYQAFEALSDAAELLAFEIGLLFKDQNLS
jgi:hypothetical protein